MLLRRLANNGLTAPIQVIPALAMRCLSRTSRLEHSPIETLARVRARFASIDLGTVSLDELRCLRAQLAAAREEQRFVRSRASAHSKSRLEKERRRLYRAQVRIAELRVEALDTECQERATTLAAHEEQIRVESQRETCEEYLEHRARETHEDQRCP